MRLRSLLAIGIFTILAASCPAQGNHLAAARQKRQQSHPWRIAPELPRALKLALRAVGHLRYSGTRVLEGKSGANRQRHTEYVVTDGSRSRIEFPAGSNLHGQVIVETGAERRHYIPARNELQIGPPQRDQAFYRIAGLAGKMVFDEASGGPVAGLPTQLVTISDRKGDVLQKLWIDPQSGMILKRELYDRGGTLQASFEFTQVNLHPIIDSTDFTLSPKGVKVITPEVILTRLIRRGQFADVRIPKSLPYRLEIARMQKIANQQVLVQQYSGKGHRLTLYQLKSAIDPARLMKLEGPEIQIYSWESQGSSFVLVGDLPNEELNDLGRRLAR